jgi:hypothetical protein
MYNIIESKYRYIFLICILGILISLFIKSTKIVEGNIARDIRKSIKKTRQGIEKAAKKTRQGIENAVDKTKDVVEDAVDKTKDVVDKTKDGIEDAADKTKDGIEDAADKTISIKSEVSAALPSLVKNILQKPIAKMKETQLETKKILETVASTQNNFEKSIANTNSNMKSAVQTNNYKLIKKQKELLSNLSQQYDMYKTGLSNEVNVATKGIKDLNENISNSSNAALESANEAKKYAELSNRIYNDVFGAISARVIQQGNAEPFTQMDSTGYTQNLFDLEKELVDAINDFNTTYYNFIRCSSGGSNCSAAAPIKEQDIIDKSNVVNDKAKALETAYTNANIQTSDATFETNHKEIMEKAKSVDELRRALDTRMDAVLKNKNPPNELTKEYDSTVYTGIMWSVLATSVLFYIFTEL